MDAAVTSLVLCSVLDQASALAELRRVLRPGGELRCYEHVISRCQPKRLLLQAGYHSELWRRIAGGWHPARDTARGHRARRGSGRIVRLDHVRRLTTRTVYPTDPRRPRGAPELQRAQAPLSRRCLSCCRFPGISFWASLWTTSGTS